MNLQEISKNQVHVSKSFLDNSILIKGDLNFSDTLEIQGSVVGNIFSDSSSISFLIIGKNSEITGDIVSSHVVVSGKVVGNINANHIEIEENYPTSKRSCVVDRESTEPRESDERPERPE